MLNYKSPMKVACLKTRGSIRCLAERHRSIPDARAGVGMLLTLAKPNPLNKKIP